MKKINTTRLIYAAICIAIGILLPQINRLIPVANIGAILSPMHIPVLLSGFLCGVPYAAFVGFILPLLNFVLTGMPPIYPIGLSMMFELATYGMLSAFLYKVTKNNLWISLIGAMIGGRIVMGIANTILFGLAGKPYGFTAFLSAAFVTALPGIIIHLIVIPAILYALKKAKLTEVIV